LNTTNRVAFAAIVAGTVAIGFAPVLVLLSDVGPSATAFYRLLFALPFLWIWMTATHARGSTDARPSTANDFLWLGLAGLFFAGDLALWHWSLQYTSVANSTLLTNCAPLFATVGARVFLHEKITRRIILGMIIAFAGASLLVGGRLEFKPNHWVGDALAFVTGAFYAAYLLTVKKLRAKFSPPTIMAWSGVVSCASLLLIAVLSREPLIPVSSKGWLAVIALALVSHLAGQTLIAFALGHLPASVSSIILLLQPLLAGLLAWVVLKERLTLGQWIGGAVILAGIFIASRVTPPVGSKVESRIGR
jgi:drug/metabolite transporter (DMT)-like permease